MEVQGKIACVKDYLARTGTECPQALPVCMDIWNAFCYGSRFPFIRDAVHLRETLRVNIPDRVVMERLVVFVNMLHYTAKTDVDSTAFFMEHIRPSGDGNTSRDNDRVSKRRQL